MEDIIMKHYKLTIQFTKTDIWNIDFYGYNVYDALKRRNIDNFIKWIVEHPQRCKIEVIG